MHTLTNTHINKVIADACTCQGWYLDQHTYVIIVIADTCMLKIRCFHQNTCKNIVHYSRIKQQKKRIIDVNIMLTMGHIHVFTTDNVCRYKIST